MTAFPNNSDTEPAQPPESPARSRKVFWIKLLSLMAVTLLLVFVMYRVVAYRALQQRVQAVRDAGYPIEPVELNDWYPTPEVNAADVYLRAFAAFPFDHEVEGIYDTLPIVGSAEIVLGDPLAPEMVERIEKYLSFFNEAIPLIEEAALIEACRFSGDYREGFNLLLPHLGQLRRSARVLQLQSILDHDRGDHDLAAQRCITILGVARSLDNEPLLISALVNISIQALAYEQIEMLVSSGKLSDAQLRELADAIGPIDLDRIMLRAMVGERCSIHGYFENTELLTTLFTSSTAIGRMSIVGLRTSGLLDIDHSSALDLMQDYVAFTENPAWPIPTELEDIENRVPRICVVTRMVIPAITACFRTSRQAEARRQATLIGIATERYRQKYGNFPVQISDLAPEFLDAAPADPFDGQQLRYRIEDTGVIIYSIGMDGVDHAGRRYNDDGSDLVDGTDITFTFGGLQDQLWPLPEFEEEDWGDLYGGGYGDPYSGGYGDPYGTGEPIEEEDEEETESEPGVDNDKAALDTETPTPTQ